MNSKIIKMFALLVHVLSWIQPSVVKEISKMKLCDSVILLQNLSRESSLHNQNSQKPVFIYSMALLLQSKLTLSMIILVNFSYWKQFWYLSRIWKFFAIANFSHFYCTFKLLLWFWNVYIKKKSFFFLYTIHN